MHIYAFGSICRGDVSLTSDVDLLAIVDGHDARFDPNQYSIYSYGRILELWTEGNPFAWHLSLEAKLLFSSDRYDYLDSLGHPKPYRKHVEDCEKFFALLREARASIAHGNDSRVFDLSTAFLAIRNFATCYSLGHLKVPDFSRNSALRLGVDSLAIPLQAYATLERARILSTRAVGAPLTETEGQLAQDQLHEVEKWMSCLFKRVRRDA